MAVSTFDEALSHHRAGRLTKAAFLYNQVLEGDPRYPDALFLLAGFDMHAGRLDPAIERLQRATKLAPKNAAHHSNLGEAYRRLRRYDDAMEALMKAMSLRPDLAEVPFNVAVLLEEFGEHVGAAACFERAQELKPSLPDVAARLASALADAAKGVQMSEGLRFLSGGALFALAVQFVEQAMPTRAVALCRRALEMRPRFAAAHNLLGVILSGDLVEGDETAAAFRQAASIDRTLSGVWGNLGIALASAGHMEEGIEAIRSSGRLEVDMGTHATLLFILPFRDGSDARSILAQAREWDRCFAKPLSGEQKPHANDRSPERRLRRGYVSPDFRNHCQSFFTVPLLSNHDREAFEVYCYSSVPVPDESTARLRRTADHWRAVHGVDDAQVAEQIRADRIDVLVDLTMHMARSRPLLFARRPAPVQICWLAYPGTTGLSAMDWRVSDPYLDPPESDTSVYSERTLRLPETFWCYDPLTYEHGVTPLPAARAGHVTFACLNNFMKVNERVIALWARVLREVPGSRMLLMAPLGEPRERTARYFESHGVSRDRIDFVGRRRRAEYLASYGQVDIGLETLPSNGHTTSLDALWMGVPIVTVVGETVVGRGGLCQAMNLGLPELVASTPTDYVQRVTELARDIGRLEDLRATLRERLRASPLMNAPRFARSMEAALRSAWREWCASDET